MAGGYSKLKIKAGTKAQKDASTNVLGDREVAFIYQDTIGKGNAKVITGDGATQIKNLPYNLGEDATDMIVKSVDTISESDANIVANKPLHWLWGAVKTKLSSLSTALAQKINYSDIYAGTDSTNNKIPLAASIGKKLQDQVTQLNGDLKNDSGYTLADGIYTVPANTNADAIIWPGLYYCNGVVIDGSKKWGYMLVMTGASNIKQIYWQNDSNRTIQRRKYSDVWSDWSEYTQKDDLGKAKYVSDLMGAQGVPTLVQWTSDTLNTPYKAGKTTSSHGFAIVYGGYSDNQVIFAMALGTTDFFIHRCSNGTPSGWETK